MNLTELGLTPSQYAEAETHDPDFIAAWLEHLSSTTGIRAPAAWFMAAIRTGRMPGERSDTSRDKLVHLAEVWIRNAGLYEPNAESLTAALFDQGCRLFAWADDEVLVARMVDLWERQQKRLAMAP